LVSDAWTREKVLRLAGTALDFLAQFLRDNAVSVRVVPKYSTPPDSLSSMSREDNLVRPGREGLDSFSSRGSTRRSGGPAGRDTTFGPDLGAAHRHRGQVPGGHFGRTRAAGGPHATAQDRRDPLEQFAPPPKGLDT
jgi:hypothetical protein